MPNVDRIFRFAVLLVAAFICGAGAALAAPKRVALVVGNSSYTSVPRLDNPSRDATLIAETLKGIGFTLIGNGPQIDLDRPALERRVREFGRAIGNDTVALFYYSGHGLQVNGANYLVPVTAQIDAASDVDFELIDLDVVLRQMDDAHSRLNIVILDACRNNPFGGRGLRDGSGGLAEVHAPRGTLISYATQPGGVARDGEPGGDSPYTLALASALTTGGIDVFKAFNMVGVKVNQETNGAQTPWVSTSPIDGEFYLAAPPAAAATGPAPAPSPAPAPGVPAPPAQTFDREAIFWQSIQNTSRPEELESYLRQFPNGTFADLARTRLAIIQSPAPAVEAPIGSGEILEAQKLLAGMGIARADADGVMGPRTGESIRLFQHAAGQAETGELTRPLLDAMRQPPPAAARAGALFALASATARDGHAGDAIGLYEQGLRLDPGNDDARREMESLQPAPAPAAPPSPPAREAPSRGGPVSREARPVLVRPPPPRPVPVVRPAPAPPPVREQRTAVVDVPVIRRSEPAAGGEGFTASAIDSRGRRFSATGSASESAAVGDALRSCHNGGDPGGCRIVAMGRAGGSR